MGEDESGPYDLDSGPDSTTFAAAAPEPNTDETDEGGEDTDAPVYAVGVGPGNLEYLTPRRRQVIRETDMIVDFEAVVGFIADETDASLLTCSYANETDALAEFGRRVAASDRGTAVLVGDPNHSGYRFFEKVQRTVERLVRVIPGTSLLRVAASYVRTLMEDTRFITLHKGGSLDADPDRLAGATNERHLLVLSRPFDWMPGDIAEFPLDSGADVLLDALVLERLTYDDERITWTTLDGLRDSTGGSGPDSTSYSDLSVPAIRVPVDAAD